MFEGGPPKASRPQRFPGIDRASPGKLNARFLNASNLNDPYFWIKFYGTRRWNRVGRGPKAATVRLNMNRWIWFLVCMVLGLALVAGGLLVPAHLRATESSVLAKAGRNSPTLVEQGLTLVRDRQLGAAQMLWLATKNEWIPRREELGIAINDLARQHPAWQAWGGGDSELAALFESAPNAAGRATESLPTNSAVAGSVPFTYYVVQQDTRDRVLALLQASTRPAVQELLMCRNLTNLTLFSPSQSASGQALDAAVCVCGLMLDEQKLTGGLSNQVTALAIQANHGNSGPLEQALFDFMSLGERFNWSQLVVFAGRVTDLETLRRLANLARREEPQLPLLFAAVTLSGQPAGVAEYLMTWSQNGLKDLGVSLRYGAGGVDELLRRNQRLYVSTIREHLPGSGPIRGYLNFALDSSWRTPAEATTLKWLLILGGGFLLAMAGHFAWPKVSELEEPLQVRGFHVIREILFALGFLLVVLLVSEPFLAQVGQAVEFPLRLRLTIPGSAAPAVAPGAHIPFMKQDMLNLLTLLLFFVLQGLLYIACLVKLAEIRRQRVPPRVQLRLLENEEHLFDAGLYLGFVGTIISLILVSLGVAHFSLMAAYSSTSFGIIFVSIFKIFHLRPARRRLVLETEAAALEPAPAPRPALAPTV